MKYHMSSLLVLFGLLYAGQISLQAQTWMPLEYNQDQKGLEYNPLKGFTTLWNPSNNFPRSLMGNIFGLDELMFGMNEFSWSSIDNFFKPILFKYA